MGWMSLAAVFEGKSRSQAIARPRRVAMDLLREEASASLPQIGALLGGRDHTTVLYGCERIAGLTTLECGDHLLLDHADVG